LRFRRRSHGGSGRLNANIPCCPTLLVLPGLETLQPLLQRAGEVLVAVIQRLLAIIARAGGKIKGVFGIWEDVAKDALRVVGAVGELSRVGQAAWDGGVRDGVIGAEGLGGHGGEGMPRVELAVAPVDVAGADGPAAEAGVEAVDVWGCGEEGYGGVGELGLAHLEGGGEGVVFGGDLVGA